MKIKPKESIANIPIFTLNGTVYFPLFSASIIAIVCMANNAKVTNLHCTKITGSIDISALTAKFNAAKNAKKKKVQKFIKIIYF